MNRGVGRKLLALIPALVFASALAAAGAPPSGGYGREAVDVAALWMAFGRSTQVTYRKGFFFGRSKNERCDLALIIM